LCGPGSEELLEYKDRTLSSTWIISFEQVRRLDTDAADLFQFLAYFSNKDIWYELIRTNADGRPAWMGRVTASKIRFDRAMMKLQDYSLIGTTAGSYSIHPCVHDWIFERFDADRNAFLAALNCIVDNIPDDDDDPQYWTITRRLLPHVNRLEDERFRKLWEASTLNEKVLDIRHVLGRLYNHWSQLDQAEKMLERTLAGKELALGHDHISTLRTVNNLGFVYANQGKLDQAEQMYKRVLTRYEYTFSRDRRLTLYTVNNLGLLYVTQSKLDQAEQMYERALAGKEQAFGYDNITTLVTVNEFGSVYRHQGKLDQAEQMYKRALAGFEQVVGHDHTLTLTAVNDLGLLYRDQGKLDQAEQMHKRALAGFEQEVGHDHTLTLNTVNNLGRLYYDQSKLDQAKEMYMRALDGFRCRLGLDHPSTRLVIENLKSLKESRSG
jgi:tetratricopeptide (TPR) repeat protein